MRERPTNPRLSGTIFPCFWNSSMTAGGTTKTSAVSPAATRLRISGAVENSTVTRVPVARSNSWAIFDTPRFTAPADNTLSASSATSINACGNEQRLAVTTDKAHESLRRVLVGAALHRNRRVGRVVLDLRRQRPYQPQALVLVLKNLRDRTEPDFLPLALQHMLHHFRARGIARR